MEPKLENFLRDAILFIPIVGDLYAFARFVEAVANNDYEKAGIYLINVLSPLPIPPSLVESVKKFK